MPIKVIIPRNSNVTDPNRNVVQLTDKSGAVTKTYEYDSFGNEIKPDGKDENPFRYCGEYYDKGTEEVYLRARYYQPAVGRFLTRDSYTGEEDDPLSLHLYTYCGNDGVNAWDPSGHKIYATEENIAGFSFYLDKYVQSTKNKSAIGKKKRNIEDIVTVKKLRKIGWKEQNIQYTKLVKALKKYKMKNKDSIAFFHSNV